MDKTTYLCGPINGCTDEECNDWRTLVKAHLNGPTIDPMRRDYRGREHLPGVRDEIVELDKIDVMSSDVLLVNHPKPSTGTDMETFMGWDRGKMVVTVTQVPLEQLSPWLTYHSHRIFDSYLEACRFINDLD